MKLLASARALGTYVHQQAFEFNSSEFPLNLIDQLEQNFKKLNSLGAFSINAKV
jgi:hypothetical protein